MSIFGSLARYAADYRERRRRLANCMEISSLPLEIQRDIGWVESETTQRPRIKR